MSDDKQIVLTHDLLERAVTWLESELKHERDKVVVVAVMEAIVMLMELRQGMNMEAEGATYNEVMAEVRKVYDRDQKLLRAMQSIRDTAVTVLQRR